MLLWSALALDILTACFVPRPSRVKKTSMAARQPTRRAVASRSRLDCWP